MAAIVIRAFVYFLAAAGVAEGLRFEAATLEPGQRFSEFGYNEFTQSALLLLAIVLLAVYVRQRKEYAALAVCMAGVFAMLLIRENDRLLELFLPHGFWKYPAALFALGIATYFFKTRTAVTQQVVSYAKTASFGVMLGGFTVLVFSRLFGRTTFWETVMGAAYFRDVKDVAEESIESLGLVLILIAVVELVFFASGKRTQ